MSNTGRLVTINKEKAEVFNNFLPQSSLMILYSTYSLQADDSEAEGIMSLLL